MYNSKSFEVLEYELLDPAIRGSRQELEQLLHPDFIEIGASGRVYDRLEIVEALLVDADDYPPRTIADFQLRKLSENLVQVFYRIIENDTRRTSIWKLGSGQWSMIYHQGTRKEA
ncbi:hypothetical protein GCM10007094_43140 [Pseudovibrio japonicus]|uniref:DUF4440 domain-containing protein n=1 Tax=Pseudovibrio japonicus TaxID=366534 RepID=A0ABQ3ERJ6_9HYPH|nr:DUF4440 domain-containing protein [Pseudovibrio japonicus]GHB49285.1 hypothetical protein GCM10007094_43140 [Pseudovibrio japonicus]